MMHSARTRGVAPLLAAVAACSCLASPSCLSFVAQSQSMFAGVPRPSARVVRFVQVPVRRPTEQQHFGWAVARLCIPPGQVMDSVRSASTYREVLELFETESTDLVHRATMLFQLSQMISKCPRRQTASLLSEKIAKVPACKTMLLAIICDLPNWKSSGTVKTRRGSHGQWSERAQYLGNLMGSLDNMWEVIRASLSENEQVLLFQRATLAALEALPDLVDNRQTLALRQIVHGLRHARRTLQSDMIFG